MSQEYLSAKQAARELGVSLPTLYAYVSRGLIRSEPDKVKRRRRYKAEDIENLRQRKQDKGSSEKGLATALSWGKPICESALSLIDQGELYYRGHQVSQLMRESSLEEVADILWGGLPKVEKSALPPLLVEAWPGTLSLEKLQFALAYAQTQDPQALDLRTEAVQRCGSRILNLLFSVVADNGEGNVAHRLAETWSPGNRRLLEAALIACADHELNVSAFTARCVASSGASPYAVVLAGLSALSGFRHGGHSYRVEALFREAESLGAKEAIYSYLQRGRDLPGFGHPLYPKSGDPRGRELLALSQPDALAKDILSASRELSQEEPNIDFALVCLSRQLQLPAGAPVLLFALGRCLGWIAHALEQYQTAKLIRPRARYVGPLPH